MHSSKLSLSKPVVFCYYSLATVWIGASHILACLRIICKSCNTQMVGHPPPPPPPRDSDWVALGWVPRICTSNMPGDAAAAGRWTILQGALASITDIPSQVDSFSLNLSWIITEPPQCKELVTRWSFAWFSLFCHYIYFCSLDSVHFTSSVSFIPKYLEIQNHCVEFYCPTFYPDESSFNRHVSLH